MHAAISNLLSTSMCGWTQHSDRGLKNMAGARVAVDICLSKKSSHQVTFRFLPHHLNGRDATPGIDVSSCRGGRRR